MDRRQFVGGSSVGALAVLFATVVAAQPPGLAPGARLRITVSSTVTERESVELFDPTLATAPIAVNADTVTVQADGKRAVVIPRPGRRVVGTLGGVTAETIAVTLDQSATSVTIPRLIITQVERSAGRRSRGRYAAFGLLLGAGGGAAVGYGVGSSCGPRIGFNCFLQPAAGTVGGIVIGGGAGALVGAFVHPAERWVEVKGIAFVAPETARDR